MLSERERAAMERRLRAALAQAWDGADDEVLGFLGETLDLTMVPASFWSEFQARGLEAVRPQLMEVYLASARRLAQQRLPAQAAVRWDLVNARAQAWARGYSFELVRGITDTSRARLQQMVSQFAARPEMDLRGLGAEIGTVFGRGRGDMIAVTEVTRASAQGELGLFDEIRRDNPQADLVQVWLTSVDERVCAVCGPRHGKARGSGWIDPPPAHPRCRCSLATDIAL